MAEGDSGLSVTQNNIPLEWRPRFVIKRIGEKDIIIEANQRKEILIALNEGDHFIQVGEYTIMLNSIKSIDPFYEPDNIPPKPKPLSSISLVNGIAIETITNQKEIDLWENIFKQKQLKNGKER